MKICGSGYSHKAVQSPPLSSSSVFPPPPQKEIPSSSSSHPVSPSSLPQPTICLHGWLCWTVQLSGSTRNRDLPRLACPLRSCVQSCSMDLHVLLCHAQVFPSGGTGHSTTPPPLLMQVRPRSMARGNSESTCGVQGWQWHRGLPPWGPGDLTLLPETCGN